MTTKQQKYGIFWSKEQQQYVFVPDPSRRQSPVAKGSSTPQPKPTTPQPTSAQAKPSTAQPAQSIDEATQRLAHTGLRVEKIGKWLWVKSSSQNHRQALKAVGFRWSKAKNQWFWRPPNEAYKPSKRLMDMTSMRKHWGSAVASAHQS